MERTGITMEPTDCKPTEHNFVAVDVTERGLSGGHTPMFKIVCTKCGTAKDLQ